MYVQPEAEQRKRLLCSVACGRPFLMYSVGAIATVSHKVSTLFEYGMSWLVVVQLYISVSFTDDKSD